MKLKTGWFKQSIIIMLALSILLSGCGNKIPPGIIGLWQKTTPAYSTGDPYLNKNIYIEFHKNGQLLLAQTGIFGKYAFLDDGHIQFILPDGTYEYAYWLGEGALTLTDGQGNYHIYVQLSNQFLGE